jgi:uncharacterized membrane-anchored protein YhcB (DUF1043 family)
MGFFIGLIIGLVIAGVVYGWLKGQVAEKERELQQNRRVMDEAARGQEERRQDLVRSLQADYQAKADAQLQQLTAQHGEQVHRLEAQIQQLTAQHGEQVRHLEADIAHLKAQLAMASLSSTPPSPAPPVVAPVDIEPVGIDPVDPSAEAADPTDAVPPGPLTPSSTRIDRIIALGQSGRLGTIGQIAQYAGDRDGVVREQVARSLGRLVASRLVGTDVQRAIPVLERLSRDPVAAVRCAAVESLGQIRSDQIIPILTRSQRDTNPQVVKAASWAIAKFKFFRPTPPPEPTPDA